MRVFTALWPSEAAIEHLQSAVRALKPDRLEQATADLRKFRFVPAHLWHLTLCFHGDQADPDAVAERLERRVPRALRQHPDPTRLRLAAGGVYRGVLWIGTEPASDADSVALRGLAKAAGVDPHGYRGHLTVARWASGRADRALLPGLFTDYAGPWWDVHEIAVVRSDQEEGARVYRTVHRVPLTRS